MPIKLCVFDAYGTLFDVAAAARHAAQEPGGEALAQHWPRLAEDWRRKQLEYSWLRSLMGLHADFRTVTAEALDWALEASGLSGNLHTRLMALYDRLEAYPEVPDMLAALKARGLAAAILSNGSPAMLAGAVNHAGIGDLLDDCLSVEAVGIFKPDPRVYALATAHFGCRPAEVLFISSNGWDVAGAGSFGFTTVWVNRAGLPQDRLPSRPAYTLPDLTGLPALLEAP